MTGVADEILVVDTGSSDGTRETATGLGARVVSFDWADDFAAACNFALDQVTTDWVLWVNPDEVLDPLGRPALAAALTNRRAFAYRLRVQQQLREDRPAYGVANRQVRLFRHDPELRFRHRLHPEFVTPPEELAAARRLEVGTLDVVVVRHAYLSRPTPDRVRWVVRLLEAELKDRPGQLAFQIELGRNLLFLNDPRGHEVLGEAADAVRRQADDPVPPNPEVGSLLEYLLTVSPEQSRGPLTRDDARMLAARWFVHTPPVVWAVAGERFAARDYINAAGLLQRLVEMGQTGMYDATREFDPSIIGPAALLNLGLCHLHLGAWAKAGECFRPLLTDPDSWLPAAELLRLVEGQLAKG